MLGLLIDVSVCVCVCVCVCVWGGGGGGGGGALELWSPEHWSPEHYLVDQLVENVYSHGYPIPTDHCDHCH